MGHEYAEVGSRPAVRGRCSEPPAGPVWKPLLTNGQIIKVIKTVSSGVIPEVGPCRRDPGAPAVRPPGAPSLALPRRVVWTVPLPRRPARAGSGAPHPSCLDTPVGTSPS